MKASFLRNKNTTRAFVNITAYIILIFACLLVLFPFMIIVSTSFKTLAEAQHLPFTFFPEEFVFDSYNEILHDTKVWRGLLNTLIIVVPVMFVGVFVSSLAAFAFSKLNFKGKEVLFSILLGSMMLPGVITMTPAYVIYDYLGLTDTFFPLMVPGLFGTAACTFFMRNYMSKLPKELIESGKVDGLNNFQIFVKIILPIIKPAIVAQVILWFFAGYNDYFGPMLYLNTQENYTLQLVLTNISSQASANMPKIMATCIVSLIPALIVYAIFQKQLINGISLNGVKK